MKRKNGVGGVRRSARILCAIVGTIVWLKLGSMLALADTGRAAWDERRFSDAQSLASGLLVGNVIERHKAPFNAGTASAAHGLFAEASKLLRTALELSPPGDECIVRLNLGLVLEKLAEQSDAGPDRERYLDEVLVLVEGASRGCREHELLSLKGRIDAAVGKGTEDGAPGPDEADPSPGASAPSPPESEMLGELREKMTQGKAQQGEEVIDGRRKPADPVEKPW